jgi:hypothetical protein
MGVAMGWAAERRFDPRVPRDVGRAGEASAVTAGLNRSAWHRRVGLVPVGFLVGTALVALVHPFVPNSTWLMLHLLLVGAVTSAILIWSSYFTDAVLHLPATGHRDEAVRLWLHTVGTLVLAAGGTGSVPVIAVAGALLVLAALVWHALSLAGRKRRALPARMGIAVDHYLAAAANLAIGIPLGIVMLFAPEWSGYGRMLAAHVHLNLFGWVGLTVLGTLLTLWPTVLRTRMPAGAETAAHTSFWLAVIGIGVLGAGTLTWQQPLAVVGLALFGIAAVRTLRDAVTAARSKPPSSFAAWSMALSLGWLAVSVVLDGWLWLTSDQPADLTAHLGVVVVPFVVGFVAQVLIGALTYLIPVVLGGGPAAVRATAARLDRSWAQRVTMANAALLVTVLPVPATTRIAVSVLVLVALVQFLVPAVQVLVTTRRSP